MNIVDSIQLEVVRPQTILTIPGSPGLHDNLTEFLRLLDNYRPLSRHFGDKTTHRWEAKNDRMELDDSVWRKLGAGLQVEYCERHIEFKDQEPGERRAFEVRAFVTCQF